MTKQEAKEYIEQLNKSGICPGLDRIKELLLRMGNPERKLRIIHVAGTNGKGSTLTYIASILEVAGYKVGKYISPTIFDYKERFCIGEKPISDAMLLEGISYIREITDRMAAEGLKIPSSFEAETALAFWFFAKKKVDFALIEVGMGGAGDATNVIPAPELAVLASISYDHMAFLGNTLAEIAAQKAGIIKKGCIVVSAAQHEEAAKVIADKAKEEGCELRTVDMSRITEYSSKNCLSFSYGNFKRLKSRLLGRYQLKNAALAIEAVLALKERDGSLKLTKECIRAGIENACWPVRFELIKGKPDIVLDGAHNEEAAIRLAESIDYYFTNRRIVYIMGMLKDKEIEKVVKETSGRACAVFTVQTPNNPRALPAIDLANIVRNYSDNVTAADSIAEALEMARLMAGEDGVVIAFGSLSYLGELRNLNGKKVQHLLV